MSETLLTNSGIKLFGRPMRDLRYRPKPKPTGRNNFLLNQLMALPPIPVNIVGPGANPGDYVVGNIAGIRPGMDVVPPVAANLAEDTVITSIDVAAAVITLYPIVQPAIVFPLAVEISANPQFARIYAFSFEGSVYTMPKPSVFLVHGGGIPIDTALRTNVDQSGVAAREWEFSGEGPNRDLSYWEYEKGDFSLRLDSEAGPLESILLAAALRAGADMADRSGASLGIRSGASLAGASLSGASLSGASVSGASLSGASLSGASLRTNR